MYGAAIRRQISSILERFENPSLQVEAEDSGALPFVIEARLEAALSQHLSLPLPLLSDIPAAAPDRNRLRRSRLYVPGGTPKLLPSIGLFGADSIILDLEDSVAASEKAAALALVRRALTSIDFGGSEKLVRINSGVQGLDEIKVLSQAGVEGFVLPKIESPDEILQAAAALEAANSPALLLPIIESARGLHFAYDIASCHSRVAAVALGVEDYLADLGAERTESGGALEWATLQLVNSCRAAGVSPLGPIYGQVDDEAGMKKHAERSASLGCDGVGCLHPRQVAAAHSGLAPSTAALEKAKRIVEAFAQAETDGQGVISLDGKMIDPPVAAQARQVLMRAGVKI